MAGFSQSAAASIFEINLRTRIVAQTSALVLAIIITNAASAAHAQTLAILHTFTGQRGWRHTVRRPDHRSSRKLLWHNLGWRSRIRDGVQADAFGIGLDFEHSLYVSGRQ